MMTRLLLLLSCGLALAAAFSPVSFTTTTTTTKRIHTEFYMAEAPTAEASVSIDPKEAVKVFGRLAQKYILLDASGGMCCYSACKDCEFRLPDGGYRMADQSASRPKWIPAYDDRNFEASGKQDTSKWSADIFRNGPAVTKEEFVQELVGMEYAPPLGGPYVAASAAAIGDTTAAEYLFDLLAGEKEKLTKHRMQTRIKEMAGGEEGLTWAAFSQHMIQQ